MEGFTIGTQEVPLPIHVKVVPISIALNYHIWDEASLTVIRRKLVHMKKALLDYPENKRAIGSVLVNIPVMQTDGAHLTLLRIP